MRIRFVLVLCLGFFSIAMVAGAKDETKLVVSLTPLSSEQLAVYHGVLAAWMDQDTSAINLADRTVPLGVTGHSQGDGHGCSKGLDLELLSPTLVHQFHFGDLVQISSGKITLVSQKQGEKNVKENDPGTAIRQGRSVDDAVKNGFAHALFTLSEIQFDKKHEHAIVSYSFVCGGLCGNGGTVVMEKTSTGWRVVKRCEEWISRTEPLPSCSATQRPS